MCCHISLGWLDKKMRAAHTFLCQHALAEWVWVSSKWSKQEMLGYHYLISSFHVARLLISFSHVTRQSDAVLTWHNLIHVAHTCFAHTYCFVSHHNVKIRRAQLKLTEVSTEGWWTTEKRETSYKRTWCLWESNSHPLHHTRKVLKSMPRVCSGAVSFADHFRKWQSLSGDFMRHIRATALLARS